MSEFEMFEKPSYSRASSMESVGSGITLGRGFWGLFILWRRRTFDEKEGKERIDGGYHEG